MIKNIVLLLSIILINAAAARANTMEMQGGETMFAPPFTKGPFVDLLLRHSSGKRAGYDKNSGKALSELQGVSYAEQGMGENSKTISLAYEEPLNGKYTLYVEAKESGIYQVDIDVLTGEQYESKTVSGLAAGGDTQEIEINYSTDNKTAADIRKKVDIYLLRREMEMAVKQGRLEKGLGKEMVEDLMHLDKALENNDFAEARYILKLLISKLANRLESFRINSRKDINIWFTSYFTANHNDMPEIIARQDRFFLNIDNINDNKKGDWFEARSVSALLEDAKIFLENIKIIRPTYRGN